MRATPLDQTFLPQNMSVQLACDLAGIVTGHAKETALVRYLSLALQYCAWTANRDATLREYEARLMSLPTEDSAQLLAVLSKPTVYALQSLDNGVPRSLVKEAQNAAAQWRESLDRPGCDALKLHQRAMALIADMLEDNDPDQLESARSIQAAVALRHPEMQLRLAANPPGAHASGAHPSGAPRSIVLTGAGPQMREFASPVEALQFVFGQLHQSRMARGAARPGEPTSALPDANAASAAAPGASEVDPTRPALRLFNPAHAVSVVQKLPPAMMPGEGNAQQRRLLDQMANDTGWRMLSESPQGDPLAELRTRFPHFAEVIDYVEGSLALAACGEEGKVVRMAPLLLRGAPGCGKTYFAQELARVLGTHFVERDLSVTSEAFVISGMDSAWKNSKPGVVLEALVNGKTANPVICLNEVDKAKGSGQHNSPMAALYALLEPTSSERFMDEFIPVALDASRVVWVLTANDGDIPEPILSRLEVFNIPNPTPDQCRAIASSVWDSLCQKVLPRGHQFATQLPPEVLDVMQTMSPRLMRKALTAAASRAVLAGRNHLQADDLTSSGNRYREVQRRAIGFSAQM